MLRRRAFQSSVVLISLASAVHDLGRTLCPSREELASRFVKFDAAQCERCRRLAREHARHVLRAASPAAAAAPGARAPRETFPATTRRLLGRFVGGAAPLWSRLRGVGT